MRSVSARLQRGVVLFISLIILVAMSLAGLALMRSVDTGTIIAANLAFRQNTTYVGDLGVEAARNWLTTSTTTLTVLAADSATTGGSGNAYYSTWRDDIDLLNNDARPDFDWSNSGTSRNVTVAPFAPPTGYTVRYVIHRLCSTTGSSSDPNAACVKAAATAASGSAGTQGAASYGSYALASPVAAVYRVTVQVTGPRNSRSYIQSVVF